MTLKIDGKVVSFDEAVKYIVDDTAKEVERLIRAEGYTKSEATHLVVWGDKRG